jgi:predicted HTH transcriptional regulator
LALRDTSYAWRVQKPDWEAWLIFFLRSLVKQKDALAKKIAAFLPDHETITLSQIVKLTKGKPSTVKLRLKELVEKGYLVPKGQRRGAFYLRSHLESAS